MPVVLGRGLNRISVYGVGVVREGETVPIGYECRRRYYDAGKLQENVVMDSDSTKVTYTCRIRDGPLFVMSTEQWEDSHAELAVLWERFVGRFPGSMRDQVRQDFAGPEAFFGYELLAKKLQSAKE